MFRKKTYTTHLSPDQVKSAILELLATKSTFIFSWPEYPGKLQGLDFSISNNILLATKSTPRPGVKGKIIPSETATVVELRPRIPILETFLCCIFPIIFISVMITTDEMTINGVVREPTLVERIFFSFFSIAIPGIVFGLIILLPISSMTRTLMQKLQLQETIVGK
ncbi:MAG TPA: hypothetical protein VGD65_22260 [Chryseosolibacter sp.]